MPQPPPGQFTQLIDRHHLSRSLTQMHWARVVMALMGGSLVVGYNLLRADGADPQLASIGLAIAAPLLLAGLVAVWWRGRCLRRRLRQPAPNLREGALRVADYVNGLGNALLWLAAVGHMLAAVATIFHFRLSLRLDGEVVLLLLAPTLLLVGYALLRVPSDARLRRLHALASG